MALHTHRRLEVLIFADERIVPMVCSSLLILTTRVTVAESEAALIQQLWERVPDVIIIGGLLPQHTVTDLCTQVRRLLQTPILVIEDGAGEGERISWLDHGADDVLSLAALSSAELIARCHALLRRVQRQRRRDPSALRLQALGLELDIVERRLYLAQGQVLDLSPTHMRLLAICFSFGGSVVLSAILAYHLTGDMSPKMLRRVTTIVHSLNQRLAGLPGPTLCIEQVRGYGYRLALVGAASCDHDDSEDKPV